MKKYTLKSLVQNGSHARKKIKSDVIIGDTNNGYGLGDILDANATMEQVNSKIDDVLGVNGENINSLIEILNDDDATTGILTQLNAKANDADLSVVAKSGSYNDLEDTPTNVSSFTNDAGYLTQHQDISGKANSADLATVATSGSYNDLSDKPTITLGSNTLYVDANGHEYVDLGLPSGTLWATMNVGASSETEYGNYYMYGKGATLYNSSDTTYSGTEDPLDSSVDTASQVWGGSWHMPTRTQMQELTANTTYQWVTNYKGSGINGGTFTATNGAVLFIPAAGYWSDGSQSYVGSDGYCWGSSPNSSYNAYYLGFNDGGKGVYYDNTESGCSVRGVINATTLGEAIASAAQQAVQQAAQQ